MRDDNGPPSYLASCMTHMEKFLCVKLPHRAATAAAGWPCTTAAATAWNEAAIFVVSWFPVCAVSKGEFAWKTWPVQAQQRLRVQFYSTIPRQDH